MISVMILINGKPIMGRSAVNQAKTNKAGETKYIVDDGTVIYHDRDDGGVQLAIKMLETIKEQE